MTGQKLHCEVISVAPFIKDFIIKVVYDHVPKSPLLQYQSITELQSTKCLRNTSFIARDKLYHLQQNLIKSPSETMEELISAFKIRVLLTKPKAMFI